MQSVTKFVAGVCALALSSVIGCGTAGVVMDPQTPPTSGRVDIEAWLSAGLYKTWKSEAAVHASRSPSPHGQNRIFSNTLLSTAGAGEYPVGAASVKELYNDAGTQLNGYAVFLHTKAGKTGDTWYFYERVPLDHPAPHDTYGVVADGAGGSGPANTICVGCHQAAGSDAAHSGHDFVYTQVK
jgi:hypothetical protein